MPVSTASLLPPARDAQTRRGVLAALERLDAAPGPGVIDLTVARRDLGRARGWAVRLMRGTGKGGGAILAEWRRPTEEAADRVYWVVMRTIGGRPGFGGIVETSSEARLVTGEMLVGAREA